MKKTAAILSKGHTLYEDDSYLLLWTKFLGLNLLALTSYYVYIKQKQSLIKLNGKEKSYLMLVCHKLTDAHGLSPKSVLNDTRLFKDFSRVIAERGEKSWQNFFAESAEDKAKSYALRVSRKDKK